MAIATTETKEVNAARRRRTYVSMRIPLVREEIKTLNNERKKAIETLKDKTTATDPETKRLKAKKTYMVVRLEVLKAEQESLLAEHKVFKEKTEAAKH